MPKREYATTEAKCRALRAARTEALDRLDDLISNSETQAGNQEWSDDIKAADEIIVPPSFAEVGFCGYWLEVEVDGRNYG